MNELTEKQKKYNIWYKNPLVWLLIAIPFLTVCGSFYTIYLAVSSKESPVLESYKKQGLAPVKMSRKDTEITALLNPYLLVLNADPVLTEPLILTFEHPTRASMDWTVHLNPQTPNIYELPLRVKEALAERWYLQITPMDKRWHIKGATFDKHTKKALENIELKSY